MAREHGIQDELKLRIEFRLTRARDFDLSTHQHRRAKNTLSSQKSQAQHQRVFSLHRCTARKAELLVVACREDCGISRSITAGLGVLLYGRFDTLPHQAVAEIWVWLLVI